jgi:two-component system, sensor histidine kinase and response regulator
MAERRGRSVRDGGAEVPTVTLGVRPPADPLVLVAVADATERAHLAGLFWQMHARTLEATNGQALVAAVHDQRPDLVALDLELPLEGGLALCRQLKASAATHLVPVIVLGDGANRAQRLAALAAGADHFLGRPVDPDELATRGRALLCTRGLVRALEERRHDLRLRNSFARFLVHDLRNPLGTALANLEVLGERLGPEPHGDNDAAIVADTAHALRRLGAMVRDLLDLDRFERGQLVPQPSVFRLGEVLAGLQRDLKYQCDEAGTPLRLDEAADVEVTADRALIERVLANLLDNALHHGPPGAPVVVEVAAEAAAVRVRVVNRGPEVPPADRARIFEPFVRVGPTCPSRGAGLGLAFCKLAVEAHGGRIAVEDAPGGGAAFVFTLPGGGARSGADRRGA